MINVSTVGMNPSIKVDGVDLAQLRAICRRVANNPMPDTTTKLDPLAHIATGYVNLIDGVCVMAQVEVPSND
jgi:hypothetical protein